MVLTDSHEKKARWASLFQVRLGASEEVILLEEDRKVEKTKVRSKLFEKIRSKTNLASLRAARFVCRTKIPNRLFRSDKLSVFGRKPKPKWWAV